MDCKDRKVLDVIDNLGYDPNNIISYAVCEQRANTARCRNDNHCVTEYSLTGYRHDKIHRTPVNKRFIELDRSEE
jgi:hypothetical protein